MQTVAIAAQKGGVGKTTLAVNLATMATARGQKVAIFDLDSQESATAWSERRKAENIHVEPISSRRLAAALTAAATASFDLVIIDTPPAAGAEAAEAAQHADLILIPCRPSLVDIDAIRRTAQLVAASGKTAAVVLNAVPPTASTLLADARSLIETTGLRVSSAVLRERSAYRSAWPFGLGVNEHEPKGKASVEVSALLDFIIDNLQGRSPAALKG